MNDPRIDHRIDRDTAERLLRGEPAGPERLAELLAAASSGLGTEPLTGEEAAVTAFRAARPAEARTVRPSRRQSRVLVGLKVAVIGLAFLLAGGVAMATTTHHRPGHVPHRPHATRTPTGSGTARTPVRPRPVPDRRPSPHRKAKAHPGKKPNPNSSRSNAHEPMPGSDRAASARAGHGPARPRSG